MNLKPIAQEHAWSQLVTLAPSLPQGLIFLGPSGVGKKRAAKALFQLLHCTSRGQREDASESSLFGAPAEPAPVSSETLTEPCGTCISCKKIAENKHVDWIELGPKGDTIPVDELREMKKTLFFAPADGPVRFVVIDEAHLLGNASANTILKTLEEPPAHTRFILVTHERSLLLPTIISRCQFVYFAPLPNDALKDLLLANGIEIPPRLLSVCLDLMAGGMSRATVLADEKIQNFLGTALSAADKFEHGTRDSSTQRWDDVVRLADELATDSTKMEILFDLLLRSSHRKAEKAANEYARGSISKQALEVTIHEATSLSDTAIRLRRRLERHANKKLIALAAADLTT